MVIGNMNEKGISYFTIFIPNTKYSLKWERLLSTGFTY